MRHLIHTLATHMFATSGGLKGITEFAGLENAGLKNDGLEFDGLENDKLEFGTLEKDGLQIVK